MSIRLTVNSVPKNRVSISSSPSSRLTVASTSKSRVAINNQQRETIRTVAIGIPPNLTTLAALTDVDASRPANNHTLVYNSNTGKYVVEELSVVNGGTF